MFRKIGLFCAAIFGIAAFAFEAQAVTINCGGISFTANTAGASACAGNISESSDLNFNGMTFSLGISDTGSSTDGTLTWITDPMSNKGTGIGLLNWSISLASNWMGTVILELKQSNDTGLFDVTGSCDFGANVCSGTWSTSGPGNAVNDLSHTRAWYKTTGTVVPLPAALPLLVGGLAVLGAAGWRRKKAA